MISMSIISISMWVEKVLSCKIMNLSINLPKIKVFKTWVLQTAWSYCLHKWNLLKVYEVETGHLARTRAAEHLKELEKKKEKSVLFKNKMIDHKNENVMFKMEITKKFHNELRRQANEAVRISCRPYQELLNSKGEFNHPLLARVVVEKKNNLMCGKNRTYSRSVLHLA